MRANFSDDGTTTDTHFVGYNSNTAGIALSTWTHVVVTFDVGTEACVFYINGSATGTTQNAGSTFGASIFNGTGIFALGTAGYLSDYTDGIVDEVGMWSRVLTSSEVTELYNSGNGLSYDNFNAAAASGTGRLMMMGMGR